MPDDLAPPGPIIGGDAGDQNSGDQNSGDQNSGDQNGREAADGQGDQNQGDGGKPDDQKPEPRAPAEYTDFTFSEGMKLDEQGLKDFKTFAKEQDLTQAQAQKLLDFGSEKLKAQIEAPYRLWADTQKKWQEELKADPEIGGTKLKESIATSARVFQPSESNPFCKTAEEAKALKDAINITGAGNNPAIVKVFVRMGELLKEPAHLQGQQKKSLTVDEKLARMYPTMEGLQTES